MLKAGRKGGSLAKRVSSGEKRERRHTRGQSNPSVGGARGNWGIYKVFSVRTKR